MYVDINKLLNALGITQNALGKMLGQHVSSRLSRVRQGFLKFNPKWIPIIESAYPFINVADFETDRAALLNIVKGERSELSVSEIIERIENIEHRLKLIEKLLSK